MRIGEFSTKHNIPKSTIRYYIKMGLLFPNRVNSQYIFDDQCDKTILLINKMKKFNFTLEEIHEFLSYDILSGAEDDEYLHYILGLYDQKRERLVEEKKEIDDTLDLLEIEIEKITLKYSNKDFLGIPLHLINLLACPICNSDVVIDSNNVKNNAIISGEAKCKSCAVNFVIEDGIIITNGQLQENKSLNFEKLKEKYISETDKQLIQNVYLSANWVGKKVVEGDLTNKVIMKNTTGLGAFLSRICDYLPKKSCFISIDNNLSFLKYTKRLVEKKRNRPDIIFICTDFASLPIKDKCVDIIIDKVNGSFYDCKKTERVMENLVEINKKLKAKGFWMGTYVYFSSFNYPKLLNKKYHKYYCKEKIKELFDYYFIEVDSFEHEPIKLKIGEYGSFLGRGDKVQQWTYWGKKK